MPGATAPRRLAGLVVCVLASTLSIPLTAQTNQYTQADLEEGAAYFMTSCADCHGPDGDVIPSARLNRPVLPRARTDADLERVMLNGIANTAMPPSSLNRRQVDTIIGYVRSLAGQGEQLSGDAVNGRSIVEGRGGCLNCHRVNGRGSRTGPDLSRIGILRRATNLRQSLVDPNAEVRSENMYLRVVTPDGDSIRGRLLNQSTDTIQLRGPDGRPVSFVKQSLRSIEPEDTSPMPSFGDRLSEEDLSDVLAYLLSLRGLE